MKKILSPFLELDLTDFVFVFAFVGTVSVFRAFIRYLTIAAQRRIWANDSQYFRNATDSTDPLPLMTSAPPVTFGLCESATDGSVI